MLKLIIPFIIMLTMPKLFNRSWFIMTPTLILLTLLFTLSVPTFPSLLSFSPLNSMDQMSFMLIILSLWITGLMFQASSTIYNKTHAPNLFIFCCITLLLTLVLCFTSSNLLFFYIWFESSLIPTMVLIMIWGYQPERIQASMYLMLYTVMASLPLLMSICYMYNQNKHLSISYPWISETTISFINSLILILAFLVKLPLFLVHLWLPKAHVEAPVAGSMILAAILLKLGGYGLLRILYLLPKISKFLAQPLMSIALIGGIITSLICLRQPDMKSIIAYSSISHMGLMCIGAMVNSGLGLYGALAMMVAHAFSSSALFCISNITYEAFHTRNLTLIKGLISINPLMSMFWFILTCINMAAPPSINLLSEILLIMATTAYSLSCIFPLMLISFLTVTYSLFIYTKINHGTPLINMNPTPLLKSNYMLLMIMHITPSILLITLPSSMTLWF